MKDVRAPTKEHEPKHVALLKSAGIPEEQIRKVLTTHLYEPLEALNRYQDAGLIDSAEVKQLPKGEGPP